MVFEAMGSENLRVSRVFARSRQLRHRSCRSVKGGVICGGGGHMSCKNVQCIMNNVQLWGKAEGLPLISNDKVSP